MNCNVLTRGRGGKCPSPRNCECKKHLNDDPVQNGLAITPSEIARLANQGVAVSVPAADQFFHDNSQGWDIPIEFKRNTDRNEVWETSHLARKRIIQARKNDKSKFE